MAGDFNDEWVTTIYENCATAMEGLQQAKESGKDPTPEDEGLHTLCEVIVYLYTELYDDPMYINEPSPSASSTRVLH
jgi:hypothetical protein